jgi:hypothetical protein
MKNVPSGAITNRNVDLHYYSAYLWAIFVILCKKDHYGSMESESGWTPVTPSRTTPKRSDKPWQDIIPFFEHGNIADPVTYDFLKRQLAEKAVAGLAKLVYGNLDGRGEDAAAKANAYPLRFAFACSIDHSGCSSALYFEDEDVEPKGKNRSEKPHIFQPNSLPDLMSCQIAEKHPPLKKIVNFTYYDKDQHPHSSCEIPRDIEKYYKHIKDIKHIEE